MNGTPWTTTDIRRLMDMEAECIPRILIAERLGRTYEAVISQLKYLSDYSGYSPKRRYHLWSDDEKREAQKQYDSGVPASTIAKQLCCTTNAVYKMLKSRKKKSLPLEYRQAKQKI